MSPKQVFWCFLGASGSDGSGSTFTYKAFRVSGRVQDLAFSVCCCGKLPFWYGKPADHHKGAQNCIRNDPDSFASRKDAHQIVRIVVMALMSLQPT